MLIYIFQDDFLDSVCCKLCLYLQGDWEIVAHIPRGVHQCRPILGAFVLRIYNHVASCYGGCLRWCIVYYTHTFPASMVSVNIMIALSLYSQIIRQKSPIVFLKGPDIHISVIKIIFPNVVSYGAYPVLQYRHFLCCNPAIIIIVLPLLKLLYTEYARWHNWHLCNPSHLLVVLEPHGKSHLINKIISISYTWLTAVIFSHGKIFSNLFLTSFCLILAISYEEVCFTGRDWSENSEPLIWHMKQF